ncbi:hypothetical protein BGW38_008371, partial [Lunasporangiospora selenospora]
RWVLQLCAPGTYCTPQGCNFVRGPVKSCKELQADAMTTSNMQQQMVNTISRMQGLIGNAMDPSWSEFEDEVLNHIDKDTQGAGKAPAKGAQSAFSAESIPGDSYEGVRVTNDQDRAEEESYLIDFTELDVTSESTTPGFSAFEVEAEQEKKKLFRTQVRIRTNKDAISSRWRTSFYVKPGQVVKRCSRGTFRQRGLKVFVSSDPSKEAEMSMVIRFVVEGTTEAPENNDTDVFEGENVPDPLSAKFQTKPIKINQEN